MLGWFRARKDKKLADSAIGRQGELYYLLSYRDEYKELLDSLAEKHGPDSREVIICELFFFRFWCTQWTYRLFKPEAVGDSYILENVIPNGLTLGLRIFEHVNKVRVEEIYGEAASVLMEERFGKFDAAFMEGKRIDPPLGLPSVVRAHAGSIFSTPPQRWVEYLASRVNAQIEQASSIWHK